MQNNPKKLIASFLLATLLSLFSLICIINFTNPYKAKAKVFIFFYVSAFLFLTGLSTLLGYWVRNRFFHINFTLNFFNSLRQGVILSIFVCSSLLLIAFGIFYWWVLISLVLLLVFLELLLLFK